MTKHRLVFAVLCFSAFHSPLFAQSLGCNPSEELEKLGPTLAQLQATYACSKLNPEGCLDVLGVGGIGVAGLGAAAMGASIARNQVRGIRSSLGRCISEVRPQESPMTSLGMRMASVYNFLVREAQADSCTIDDFNRFRANFQRVRVEELERNFRSANSMQTQVLNNLTSHFDPDVTRLARTYAQVQNDEPRLQQWRADVKSRGAEIGGPDNLTRPYGALAKLIGSGSLNSENYPLKTLFEGLGDSDREALYILRNATDPSRIGTLDLSPEILEVQHLHRLQNLQKEWKYAQHNLSEAEFDDLVARANLEYTALIDSVEKRGGFRDASQLQDIQRERARVGVSERARAQSQSLSFSPDLDLPQDAPDRLSAFVDQIGKFGRAIPVVGGIMSMASGASAAEAIVGELPGADIFMADQLGDGTLAGRYQIDRESSRKGSLQAGVARALADPIGFGAALCSSPELGEMLKEHAAEMGSGRATCGGAGNSFEIKDSVFGPSAKVEKLADGQFLISNGVQKATYSGSGSWQIERTPASAGGSARRASRTGQGLVEPAQLAAMSISLALGAACCLEKDDPDQNEAACSMISGRSRLSDQPRSQEVL